MLSVVHVDLLAPYVLLDELLVWAMSLRTLISLDNRVLLGHHHLLLSTSPDTSSSLISASGAPRPSSAGLRPTIGTPRLVV